jgi:hypothetical protein
MWQRNQAVAQAPPGPLTLIVTLCRMASGAVVSSDARQSDPRLKACLSIGPKRVPPLGAFSRGRRSSHRLLRHPERIRIFRNRETNRRSPASRAWSAGLGELALKTGWILKWPVFTAGALARHGRRLGREAAGGKAKKTDTNDSSGGHAQIGPTASLPNRVLR